MEGARRLGLEEALRLSRERLEVFQKKADFESEVVASLGTSKWPHIVTWFHQSFCYYVLCSSGEVRSLLAAYS